MKPELQRIAIAEACGWVMTTEQVEHTQWTEWTETRKFWVSPHGKRGELPDYLNDLNAMHEAEKVLTQQQRIEYVRELGYIWTGRNDRAIPNWWFVHDATATQRAEAFLRTIGKWEEEA
jgi:hypothetical protein